MTIFHQLLIVAVITVYRTNCAAVDSGNALRPQIDSLLVELKSTSMDAVLYWNLVALQANANDYDTSVTAPPEQPGPTASTRASAIIHGAMYDAMAVFNKDFKPLFRLNSLPNTDNVHKKSAVNAAIMEAAYQTLSALYSKQQAIFDAIREEFLGQLDKNGKKQAAIDTGILVGQSIAAFILADRQNDGSQVKVPYTPIMLPGFHQVDPIHPNQGFAAPNWGNVKPFLLESGSQYRPSSAVGNTPAAREAYLNSSEYIQDFNEVKSLGSKTSTTRTDDQTEIGNFWAYDGGAKIGVPSRLYNQLVRVIAIQKKNTLEKNAYLFALINYAMADATIAAWDCKYDCNTWRPIVGIRQATGYTQADPNWLPLGVPTNTNVTNLTPAFPSFLSGHAAQGSATFEILRLFYKSNKIKFQLCSDEYNGKTFDSNTGQVRPKKTRYYQSFSQAEKENVDARIYLGVHWKIDQTAGETLGHQVAQYVFEKLN